MMDRYKWLLIPLFFLMIFQAWANPLYPFDSSQKEAQFQGILKDLRCLVCQNQDLADSNAQFAKDLRQKVYLLIQEGKTNPEIAQYLTERYGDFILFKPPIKSLTFFLWFGPLFFLVLGLFVFWRYACRGPTHAGN
jgi:cytochrome c-type biogenesis protein CcmH